jgi:hypothetical protein
MQALKDMTVDSLFFIIIGKPVRYAYRQRYSLDRMHDSMNEHIDSAQHIGLGIVAGILGAILVYSHAGTLGFGMTLFSIILIVLLFGSVRLQGIHPLRRNLFLLVPALLAAIFITVRADPILLVLNLLLGMVAALLTIRFFTEDNALNQSLYGYGVRSVVTGFAVSLQPVVELLHGWHWVKERRTGLNAILPVLRGIIIAVPIVAVFAILFASADALFSDMLARALNALYPRDIGDLMGSLITGGILGWLSVGGFAIATLDRKHKHPPAQNSDQPVTKIANSPVSKPLFTLGFIEVVVVLGSVCALFASFVALQFAYLFGGLANLTRYNYAEYLHRGFLELVIVAVLTLGMSYVLNTVAVHQTVRQHNILRGLLTLLIVLTTVILVSAFQRLRLYEDAYGFTTLRLMVYVFIVWLGILLIGFVVSLYWNLPGVDIFGLVSLLSVFGFGITLNVINPDAFVAHEMIDAHNVDPAYLISLSDEAVPAMLSLVNAPEPGLQAMVRNELSARYMRLSKNTDWRVFTLGRAQALAAITPVLSLINVEKPAYLGSPYGVQTLSLTPDDFKMLRQGMTYREVLRQFGEPQAMRQTLDTYSRAEGSNLQLIYATTGTQQDVFVNIDWSGGVSAACIGSPDSVCYSEEGCATTATTAKCDTLKLDSK